MQLSFTDDIAEFDRMLTDVQRKQLPFVINQSLNAAAFDARKEFQDTLPRVLDRPKPFTARSVFVRKAAKTDPKASVEFKDELAAGRGTPAGVYLQAQVFGGERSHKRFEKALIARGIIRRDQFAVPAPATRLDRYGALSGGQIIQILSALSAAETAAGFQANITPRSRGRNPRRLVYFATEDSVFSRRGTTVTPVLVFVSQVNYQPPLDMDGILTGVVGRVFPDRFAERFREQFNISGGGSNAPF